MKALPYFNNKIKSNLLHVVGFLYHFTYSLYILGVAASRYIFCATPSFPALKKNASRKSDGKPLPPVSKYPRNIDFAVMDDVGFHLKFSKSLSMVAKEISTLESLLESFLDSNALNSNIFVAKTNASCIA